MSGHPHTGGLSNQARAFVSRRFYWVCLVGTMRYSLAMALHECDRCGYRADYDEGTYRRANP